MAFLSCVAAVDISVCINMTTILRCSMNKLYHWRLAVIYRPPTLLLSLSNWNILHQSQRNMRICEIQKRIWIWKIRCNRNQNIFKNLIWKLFEDKYFYAWQEVQCWEIIQLWKPDNNSIAKQDIKWNNEDMCKRVLCVLSKPAQWAGFWFSSKFKCGL